MSVTGMLCGLSPVWVPRLCLQCVAAPIGGASATVFTTPLDAIRARIQVMTFYHFLVMFSSPLGGAGYIIFMSSVYVCICIRPSDDIYDMQSFVSSPSWDLSLSIHIL